MAFNEGGAWLAAHPRRYACPGVPGGAVRLHLETNPLRILQMGNLFGTCLSRGDGSAVEACARQDYRASVPPQIRGGNHVQGIARRADHTVS